MFEEIESQWTLDSGSYDDLTWKQLKNKRLVQHWKQILNKYLGSSPLRILEVGCGPGFLSILLSEMGHSVKSVDGSIGMIQHAQKNMEMRGITAEVALEDAVLLPDEDPESFDVILSRDVVWTLYDPDKAMARWHEVLKPGGKLLYFDGNYQETKPNLKIKLWIALADVLILVTERRWYSKEAKGTEGVFLTLPLSERKRPETDRQILKGAGFRKIRIRDDRWRNRPWSMGFWKYGYQGKKFLVLAQKENE